MNMPLFVVNVCMHPFLQLCVRYFFKKIILYVQCIWNICFLFPSWGNKNIYLSCLEDKSMMAAHVPTHNWQCQSKQSHPSKPIDLNCGLGISSAMQDLLQCHSYHWKNIWTLNSMYILNALDGLHQYCQGETGHLTYRDISWNSWSWINEASLKRSFDSQNLYSKNLGGL